LIEQLDRPMEQVEIEVMIANTQKNFIRDLGVSFGNDTLVNKGGTNGVVGGAVATLGANALTAATPTALQTLPTAGNQISPLSLLPAASGDGTVASFLYRGANFALTAQLNALEQDNKVHILSVPRVVTLDNIMAKITQDDTLFVPTSSGANSAGAYLQIPAGLTLNITPSVLHHKDVGEENMVRMVIQAENTTAAPTPGSNTASKSGQTIQTQVIIPDGSTFIMGGLTNDNRVENLGKVPLLADVPLLGELFKTRDSQQSLTDVLFFITPRIVAHADLYAKDVAEKRYLQNERAEIGQIGEDVRTHSMMLNLNTRTLEEDE